MACTSGGWRTHCVNVDVQRVLGAPSGATAAARKKYSALSGLICSAWARSTTRDLGSAGYAWRDVQQLRDLV